MSLIIRSLVFFLIVSTVFSLNAKAEVGSDACVAKITQIQKWKPMTSDQLTCMNSDPEYTDAMPFLCLKDKTDLSIEYQKYLKAKDVYAAAWQKYRAATDGGTRSLAAIDMRIAEQDWSLGGFRQEVDAALGVVSSIHFNCSQ